MTCPEIWLETLGVALFFEWPFWDDEGGFLFVLSSYPLPIANTSEIQGHNFFSYHHDKRGPCLAKEPLSDKCVTVGIATMAE